MTVTHSQFTHLLMVALVSSSGVQNWTRGFFSWFFRLLNLALFSEQPKASFSLHFSTDIFLIACMEQPIEIWNSWMTGVKSFYPHGTWYVRQSAGSNQWPTTWWMQNQWNIPYSPGTLGFGGHRHLSQELPDKVKSKGKGETNNQVKITELVDRMA